MQIVQPSGSMLPNQASAGVGAVIFDKPSLDAAQVQRNVDADLDNFARKKAADNAKVVAEKNALIADLKFDDKGVFPDDKGYFKGGKEELIKANERLYSLEPNTQAFREAEKEAKRLQGYFSSEAVQSAEQWKQFQEIDKDFNANPDKYDQKVYKEWLGRVRTNQNPEKRNALFQENPLVPKVGNFQQMLGERLTKGLYKPQETEGEIRTKGGRTGVQKIVQYTDENIKDYSRAIMSGDEDMTESASKGLDDLKANHRLLYDKINDEANQLGVDVLELYIRKQLKNSFTKQQGLSNLAFDPKETAAFSFGLSEEKEDGGMRFTVEQLGNLFNGAEGSYTVGGEDFSLSLPSNVTISGQMPKYSDQFQGGSMGKYVVDEIVRDPEGNPVKDPTTNKYVSKKVTKDNIVLGWKFMNGKPYIQTEETLYNAGKKIGGVSISQDGWKQANQTDGERFIIANVAPSKRLEALDSYRRMLSQGGGYDQFKATPQKITEGAQPKVESGKLTVTKPQPKQEATKMSFPEWKAKNPNGTSAEYLTYKNAK